MGRSIFLAYLFFYLMYSRPFNLKNNIILSFVFLKGLLKKTPFVIEFFKKIGLLSIPVSHVTPICF